MTPPAPAPARRASALLPTSRRSRTVLAAAAGALVVAAGATTAWATSSTTVQLTVDGRARSVSTHGDTVADVLSEAGLRVGAHDLLAPAATARVSDGDVVALRRGRPLKLVVDGVARTAWVTADDVDEALGQVGLRTEGAALSASRSRAIGLEGLALDVRMPKTATVVVDGTTTPRTTTAATVGDLLTEAAVTVRPTDTVSVPVTAPVTAGLAVTVTRIDTSTVTEDVAVGFPTVETADPAALVGTRRVTQPGRPGSDRRTYTVTLTNGVETARVLAGTERTAQPQPQVVSVGSRPKPAPVVVAPAPAPAPKAAAVAPAPAAPKAPSGGGGTVSGTGGLNWAALAKCESGGNPRAVGGGGRYFGLYQFSTATWAAVGGSGNPADASPAEQTHRAQLLYARSGRGQWPVCGKYL